MDAGGDSEHVPPSVEAANRSTRSSQEIGSYGGRAARRGQGGGEAEGEEAEGEEADAEGDRARHARQTDDGGSR